MIFFTGDTKGVLYCNLIWLNWDLAVARSEEIFLSGVHTLMRLTTAYWWTVILIVSPAPSVTVSPSSSAASSAAAPAPQTDVDPSKPVTTIQIRLADGQRSVLCVCVDMFLHIVLRQACTTDRTLKPRTYDVHAHIFVAWEHSESVWEQRIMLYLKKLSATTTVRLTFT